MSKRTKNNRRRGVATKQAVLTVVLIVVIGATAAFIWSQLKGDPVGERIVELGYRCSICQHEWTMTNQEYHTMERDPGALKAHPDRTRDQPHCPQCGQKHTGMSMRQCPECRKFFFHGAPNPRVDPDFIPPPPVCTHCGTDLNKWREENR